MRRRPRFPSRRGLVATLVAVAAVAVAVTSAVAAAPSHPATWPGRTITYSDTSGWTTAVREAVAQWNATGAGPRFVPAPVGRVPQLRVLAVGRAVLAHRCPHSAGRCIGYATMGRQAADHLVLPRRSADEDAVHSPEDVRLVVHELGHVLGLTHADVAREPCAAMHHFIELPDCRRPDLAGARDGHGACGPFAADVRALARRYGTRPRRVSGSCLHPVVRRRDARLRARFADLVRVDMRRAHHRTLGLGVLVSP